MQTLCKQRGCVEPRQGLETGFPTLEDIDDFSQWPFSESIVMPFIDLAGDIMSVQAMASSSRFGIHINPCVWFFCDSSNIFGRRDLDLFHWKLLLY